MLCYCSTPESITQQTRGRSISNCKLSTACPNIWSAWRKCSFSPIHIILQISMRACLLHSLSGQQKTWHGRRQVKHPGHLLRICLLLPHRIHGIPAFCLQLGKECVAHPILTGDSPPGYWWSSGSSWSRSFSRQLNMRKTTAGLSTFSCSAWTAVGLLLPQLQGSVYWQKGQ